MKKLLLLAILFANVIVLAQTKNITVDFNTTIGKGKKMTGVNTGPSSVIAGTTTQCLQSIGNELIRTHDYHGDCDYWGYTKFFNYFKQSFDYTFKTHDPLGYIWKGTDAQLLEIASANMQPFFRLGISFPGGGVSPASPMPKDEDNINFRTFAGIAKRTAMHYTAAWDSGFNYTIPYWEIWNEPNNNASWDVDSVSAYYRLYQQCVDSLKSFNPLLKVGGPGAAKNAFYTGGIRYTINHNYVSDFFNFCKTNNVPLDFYSFHMYDKKNPYSARILTDTLAYFLNQYGLDSTELIISETNVDIDGYVNTSKGCSYLTSQLISLTNSRLSKYIWYRGIDLNPLCNADNGSEPSLTLNGYAYKFYNELNDVTPILLSSSSNIFSKVNVNDSLNNVMILAGKDSSNSVIKILISNHESSYSAMQITLQNVNWNSTDQIALTTDQITSAGFATSTKMVTGDANIIIDIPSVTDASVFLITLTKESQTAIATISNNEQLVFYPNPASSKMLVQTPSNLFSLNVINAQGQRLFNQINNAEIDITNLPNGLYFVTLQDVNGGIKCGKFVVKK